MLAEDDRGRRQLRDPMARGLANGATLCLAESVAAGAALGPVVDQLIDRLDRPQRTTASRMARLGAGPPARGRLTRPRWRRGWILAGGQRGVARVSVAAVFKVGNADLKPPVRRAQLGDLSPKAERSAPRARGAQRRPSQAPAHRSPQPRRVPCPRASRRAGEGLPMPPRRSPPRRLWVDRLNGYQKPGLCGTIAHGSSCTVTDAA